MNQVPKFTIGMGSLNRHSQREQPRIKVVTCRGSTTGSVSFVNWYNNQHAMVALQKRTPTNLFSKVRVG